MLITSEKRKGVLVREPDPFLALFPHRFDYLVAQHPDPGQRPQWSTESCHPLTDRLITQGSYLYGVRFGKQTHYALLDIDKGSPYHPRHDCLAFEKLVAALEPLGLVRHVPITSSDSGGLHLYFPFDQPLPSYEIALAISALLENQGFKCLAGWIEVFPNTKPFSSDGAISLFNGHRLPMGPGSYLLDDSFAPIAESKQAFVTAWARAESQNDIDTDTLRQVIKQAKRKAYRISTKADKFLNDLNAAIEPGWTGPGQTNHILGRITQRSYIFGHVLGSPAPLTGDALVQDIIQVARSLPGFQDWCNHTHEIEDRAKDWVRSVENSHYFPYGIKKKDKDILNRSTLEIPQPPTWNQRQESEARQRIQNAIACLMKDNTLPNGITQRFDALTTQGISGSTLYKHRDLWHPRYIEATIKAPLHPPDPPIHHTETARQENLAVNQPNLLGDCGCNHHQKQVFSPDSPKEQTQTGCNFSEATVSETCDHTSPVPRQLKLSVLATIKTAKKEVETRAQDSLKQQEDHKRHKHEHAKAQRLAQLHQWLHSGDPILEAEARAALKRLEPE